MNQYAAAVLLRHTDGRTHSVAVVNTCPSPEHAITCAEASALKTVAPEEGWSVESSWLFDQHLIDAEFHPAPDRFAGERGAPFDEPLRSCTICGFTVDLSKGHVAPDPESADRRGGKRS